ncbi:MAG: lipid-A-disaccharide synthase [Wenzhouxiangellaceae bacterium]|nr:lipid-A-disaccharide synthase [Wenzhouxiangellaceae bacterium]
MRLAVSAGEHSGDQLGAALVGALREQQQSLELIGVAGPELLAAGVEPLASMDELGVMGLFEVIGHLPRLSRLRSRLRRQILDRRVDAFIGIDAPDFNLGLARRIRRAGVPAIQLVAPSVWAWRQYRIAKIARSLDLLLTLFPFEPALFQRAGLDARFIGHPLADVLPFKPDRAAARAELSLAPDATVVALLPGSRDGELALHAQRVSEVGRRLIDENGVQVLLLLAEARHRRIFEQFSGADPEQQGFRLLTGQTRRGLAAADVALAASGTVTLEALLTKTPMVVFYCLAASTYRMARMFRLVKSRWISLPNVLANASLVPERIQHAASTDQLLADVRDWLDRPARVAEFQRRALEIHHALACNAAQTAAGIILERIGRPRGHS